MAQTVKNLPAMRETQVQSLGREDPLQISIPVFLSGEFHEQRSLVVYSPWGLKQAHATNTHTRTHIHTHTHTNKQFFPWCQNQVMFLHPFLLSPSLRPIFLNLGCSLTSAERFVTHMEADEKG